MKTLKSTNVLKNIFIKMMILVCVCTNTNASDFSSKDHIELKKLKIKSEIKLIDWSKLSAIKIDSSRSDKINTRASGVTKLKKNQPEEMVFFSYENNKEKKKIDKKSTIKAKKAFPIKLPVKISSKKKTNQVRHNKKSKFIDYTSFIQSSYEKEDIGAAKIKLVGIGENGENKKSYEGFDFVPLYDLNEIITDNGTGIINIPVSSSGMEYSTLRGSVAARGIIRTNFELSIQRDEKYLIPVYESEAFDKIIKKLKINQEYGSHLLIDLGNEIDSTEIEGRYKEKIYLNAQFKVVDEASDYEYELYLDVVPGNHLVRYMNRKGSIAEKILHIVQAELTYDSPNLVMPTYTKVELFEENLVSKRLGMVTIDEKNISYFNKEKSSSKVGLNLYKIEVPLREASFRKYLNVTNQDRIYIGYDNDGKLVLPSKEYSDYIIEMFNLRQNNRACLIQINLTKALKEFKANITSDHETGSYDIYFMDKDGSVGEELTGLTERIFIISNDYGVMNSKIQFTDKKIRYLQSFCTESLYLVEQL